MADQKGGWLFLDSTVLPLLGGLQICPQYYSHASRAEMFRKNIRLVILYLTLSLERCIYYVYDCKIQF